MRRTEWHQGEDEALERYVHVSSFMDRAAVSLLAIVPRGWILVGLCGLAPTFVSGEGGTASPTALAIGLGGILLGFKAFHRLTAGVWSLAGAAIAWRQTAPIFAAATRRRSEPVATVSTTDSKTAMALDATDLRFTHTGRNQPVLRGCTLSLSAGERVILQGPSGCGKSTLASLLAGLRMPQSGLLLADGLDRHTLGLDGWRRRVVLVPQFHENHLALGSVAFNLLMGAEWPRAKRTSRAPSVCCATSALATRSTGCRRAFSRRSAKPAGSSRTASVAASISHAPCSSSPTSSSSTRASLSSIPRTCTWHRRRRLARERGAADSASVKAAQGSGLKDKQTSTTYSRILPEP